MSARTDFKHEVTAERGSLRRPQAWTLEFGAWKPNNFGFISDEAWFYSFLRVLRHDFCSIVSNERFLIQNRVIEAFPTPKAEK